MIQEQLTKFRENFQGRKVWVDDDCLSYTCPRGKSYYWAKEANELIEKLELPLVAIPVRTLWNNVFVVKSAEVEL